MMGKVYLVGSGPGGEGLLTQRARVCDQHADVILFDQLPGDEYSCIVTCPTLKRSTAGSLEGAYDGAG